MAKVILGLALIALLALPSEQLKATCFPGETSFGESCYEFVSDPKTFADAANDCEKRGGGLVTIFSEEENKLVNSISYSNIWIGLNDIETENTFKWKTDESKAVSYNNWHPNEPNNYKRSDGTDEDCAMMLKSTLWNDLNCSEKLPYVCKYKADRNGNTDQVYQGKCLPGESFFGESCFAYVNESKAWEAAGDDCKKKGGALASIWNKDENMFVNSITKTNIWIGLNDIATENEFSWKMDESKPMKFSYWNPKEPNNGFGRGENCVTMSSAAGWNDLYCTIKLPYVCKFDAAQTDARSKPEWEVIENSYIAANNHNVYETAIRTLEECKNLCKYETQFVCRSIDYWKSKKRCYRSKMTIAEAKMKNLIRSHSDYELWQRN